MIQNHCFRAVYKVWLQDQPATLSHGSMLQKQLPRSLPGSLDQELWGEAQQSVSTGLPGYLGACWDSRTAGGLACLCCSESKQRTIWVFLKGCKQTRLCTQPRWPTRPKILTPVASYRKRCSSREEGPMVETLLALQTLEIGEHWEILWSSELLGSAGQDRKIWKTERGKYVWFSFIWKISLALKDVL